MSDGSSVGLLTSGRVEAFSDGVIAIAATLLVLELHVPEAGADVWAAIGRQLPSLAAYVVSFGTILIFWVNHHTLFHLVARVDRTLLFLNGLLLLGSSFISFPTAVLGGALEHDGWTPSSRSAGRSGGVEGVALRGPASDSVGHFVSVARLRRTRSAFASSCHARSAAVFYAAALGFTALCFTALLVHLHRHPHLMTEQARPTTAAAIRRSLPGPALYAASAVVAVGNAPAALAVDAVVALYFTLPPRHLRGV